MALRHKSVATISSPEFINLEEDAINPGISKCEIKVFYLGQNRNGSYFDKVAANKMAKTIRGVPVVGVWHDDEQDFGDHGECITIENGEISFSCKTVPYGFTDPVGQVWYQDFEDFDEFGNSIGIHTYMMTTGYLWTGQYPELQSIFDGGGKGQSMEIDPKKGHWAQDAKSGVDFYIVEDADFLKLCILGDSVEPAMESASITAPDISQNFSVDGFKKSLYDMMQELRFSLQGRLDMSDKTEEVIEDEVVEEPAGEVETFTDKKEDDDTSATSGSDDADSSDDSDDDSDESDSGSSDDDDKKKPSGKNSLEEENERLSASLGELQTAFDELKNKFEAATGELEELRSFKASRERADKDALIAKYHMLSDEDKADVIENIDNYTLDEIDAKLALTYVHKNVDFETVDGQPEVEEEVPTTFSLDETEVNEVVDPMVAALREAENY